MEMNSGFILTSDWSDTTSGMELNFYGTSGVRPFKLVFSTEKLVFFIARKAEFNPQGIKFERKSQNLKSFNHEFVDTIYLQYYRDLLTAKDYCKQNSIAFFEADIQPTERFLMERFINGQVEFIGEKKQQGSIDVYLNPEVRACKGTTSLSILSLDIETGVGGELYSIGLHFETGAVASYGESAKSHQKVLMLNDRSGVHDDLLTFYDNEKAILIEFMRLVELWDPDLIAGWHVIGFDLKFLEEKCHKFKLSFNIGRTGKKMRLTESKASGYYADIPGRVILDGPRILRGAFYRYKNFKLETVAEAVLGLGKDIASDGGKVSEIERRFKEDKPALAKYNLLDCTLVTDIYKKLNIIDLLIKRVHISGLLIDRLQISTAAFDFLFLPKLHRKGYIAPNKLDFAREDASSGGMVIEPTAGLHHNVAIFDFKSLYPSIIMTFKIDPYSLIQNKQDPLQTPDGYRFSKTEHILPEIIDTLMQQRELAKLDGNSNLSQSIKILMNSFYGVMGSSSCRFYHAELPMAITTSGHWILRHAIDFFKNKDLQVVYGDTDSIFVKLSEPQTKDAAFIESLSSDLDYFLEQNIKDEFKVKSRLICEHEKTYDQVYFSKARSGEGTAKKRYAGIKDGELEFKGMEFVRSDWTELAKRFQKELYEMFFNRVELEYFIKNYIKSFEAGEFDDLLVYSKRLSKAPEEYVKNIPIHVKAALKINHKGPYRLKEVSYVITKLGPEPVIELDEGHQNFDFDYDHYIQKQLKPIANDLLHSVNKDFDSCILGTQLSLF